MKIMISQPMRGLTSGEIVDTRKKAIKILEADGYEIVDTYFNYSNEHIKNEPLYYLSKSIEKMSECDAVAFVDDWKKCRGCKIEHEIAEAYGLQILYVKINSECNSQS